MKRSILVIEDEQQIARVLELELRHEGYEVKVAGDGLSGLELALGQTWSLIVLDVMLPGSSGLEVLRRLRQDGRLVPVILLTARDSTPDIVGGFEQGANDYVTKPFVIEELLARIRNLIRMTEPATDDQQTLTVGDLVLEPASRKVMRGGRPIELTPTEFELLHYMMKHAGQVLSREQIITDVWGYEHTGDTNIVDVYVRYLRLKIDKGHRPKLIRTARGIGYALSVPDV
ncbi:response regulator transcription factor [Paenibacillus validus]|uniref:Response regulator n=1 Tax=Paenibacillus validus TaxID=44253 RepID=A0A7X2Z8K0_9BACL|nr:MULTISPECIES: response regulator transcription factor [Paenibacillus]MED4603109.1 response regulator transcription factor [Paenibacillus validus]MED4608674.1 response regulator transcription factor [Paenibacillus validus]MUG69725.1 response regulator [Paenibacillus validus]